MALRKGLAGDVVVVLCWEGRLMRGKVEGRRDGGDVLKVWRGERERE